MMRRLARCLFPLLIVAVGIPVSSAQTMPAPTVAARAWVLLDYGSGQVLAQGNPDTPLEPASLTKVMTAYMAYAALKQNTLKLDQPVTVSERAWRTQGSRMFIPVNKQVAVDDLLKGLVIQSGNDAAVALAETIGGSEDAFAGMMNRQAALLGMSKTRFLNASGYFEGPAPTHVSTARDLSRLAAALIRDYPQSHALHATKEYSFNGIHQYNRNRLLWLDPTVDGLKTGHSSAAGYCQSRRLRLN